jgi:long-chain acyl-CoA synthetase
VSTPPSTSAPPSVADGGPLAPVAELLGGVRIDDLLRRAASAAPDRVALRAPNNELTYAELDTAVTRCAAALTALVGKAGAVVAVASVLDPVFAIAYYGTARSGNTSAILNPLLPGEALAHILNSSGARAAVVTPQVWERLRPIRHRLTEMRYPVLTERGDADGGDLPVLTELMDLVARNDAGAVATDPAEVACVLFTSGTTGAPKAVPLTHRNLTTNAAQTVDAQELRDTSVLLNYLPTFHTMHLNAGVCAAATHVLHHGDDVAASIEVANRYGATHYYSLPMRLSRLAADPRLPGLRLRTARALLSGGSALPPPTAAALAEQFGIPVVQGYGLAEASPLTHFNRLDDPRPGSCGRPVAGTQCRVVEVTSRAVLPVGEKGEIQLRGPQLMSGYLGQDATAEIDADGWFSTGDIGHFDADGHLYLTDRLKDVFKCDNFLVSPTEVESVLRRHPAVADCVVVDQADEFSGAVAYGLVVLRDPSAGTDAVLGFANERLPYFMHLRHLEPVESIPRSQNGKVQRRDLRDRVRALGQRHVSTPPPT